jgi:hypothetical protein
MVREREVTPDLDPTGTIHLSTQPLTGGRGSHTRSPDYRLRRETFACDQDAVGVNGFDRGVRPNLYPETREGTLGLAR